MASTKVTPAEEIRRIRAFCDAHGIKFTLVPGKAKPWPKPSGTFVKPTLAHLRLLGIPVSEKSLSKWYDDCRDLIRQQPMGNHRTEIEAYLDAGRAVLAAGNVQRAADVADLIGQVLQRPEVEKTRERQESAKTAAGTRWDPTAGDRRARNQAWCKFAAPLRANGLSWPAIARRIKSHFQAQEAVDSIRRIIRPAKKAGH
jgi:hypothetical protein